LSASINCESPKTEKESKRELLNNTTLADPLDFFDVAKTGTCATLGQTEKENIFKNLMAKELNNKLTRSSTIRVLKDSTKMIYEYYTIQDNKDGSFTTEKDKELIQAANKAMEKMKNDFLIIDKINTTSLKLWEKVTKKEKDLSINSGLGGIGICNVTAENIIKFIQSYEKTRELSATIGKDESTANLTTNKIEFLPKDQAITFSIKKNSIDLKNASTTIANESYTLDYDNNGNKLLFEKGKAKEPAKKKD
jgi:ribosomal protein S5